jgi:hypothetical protein
MEHEFQIYTLLNCLLVCEKQSFLLAFCIVKIFSCAFPYVRLTGLVFPPLFMFNHIDLSFTSFEPRLWASLVCLYIYYVSYWVYELIKKLTIHWFRHERLPFILFVYVVTRQVPLNIIQTLHGVYITDVQSSCRLTFLCECDFKHVQHDQFFETTT